MSHQRNDRQQGYNNNKMKLLKSDILILLQTHRCLQKRLSEYATQHNTSAVAQHLLAVAAM